MSLRMTRPTVREWLLGAVSVLLLVDLFATSWFAYPSRFHALAAMLGQSSSANGWNSFTAVGPLTLVVCLAGIAVLWLSAARSAPALPVTVTTLLLPVSLVQAALVAIRVLLDPPSVHLVQAHGQNVIEARAGAYVGLGLSIILFVADYLSLRREAVADEDSPTAIPRVSIEESRAEHPA